MKLGVCWYPEHWPEDRWATDASMMADLGLELVRIGEFAWSAYEAAPEAFAWGWLDRAVDVLAEAGLGVVLGTPTATPPVWLAQRHPEILSVGPDGRRRAYGSRRHTCPTAPTYREHARRVVTRLVERYGDHPAVVAWQIDNEPGNHDSARCWCDACQAAFTGWLEDRYGTVAALDEAWGTVFWSGTYPDLASVRLPVPTMTSHLPALELAHRRFASAQVVDGLAEQRATVAAGSPDREILTNLYLGDLHVDARAVGQLHGIGAVDNYPHDTADPLEVGFVLDLARGTALGPDDGRARRGGRAWVMEQQPGRINWTPDNPLVPPGQVRTWGLQAALHGIETLLFFRWRMARIGQEQHHAALLRHDDSPSRAFEEVRELRAQLDRLRADGLLDRPPARAALWFDYADAWTVQHDPHRAGVSHHGLVLPAYRAARRLGFDVDVVPVDADLSGYELVLAPCAPITTPDRVRRLLAAADGGATVVVGPRSLLKDPDDVWVDVPMPAGLTDRLGARVEEQGSSATWPATVPPPRVAIGGRPVPAGPWLETLAGLSEDTQVMAEVAGGPLDGLPVAVRRGALAYMGCSSDEAWVGVLARVTGVTPGPAHLERFDRAAGPVVLDHRALRLTSG